MTNREAIKELETYAKNSWGELNEAFELAIKALSEEKIAELERLAEIGKATEKAYQEGYVVAEVEQIVDPFNENALRIVCYHAFGTIEKLVEYLNEKEVE